MGSLLALPYLRTQEPDVVLYNGNFWTLDEAQPTAQAVTISDGRFIAVGSNDEILHLTSARTKKIDLAMKTVLPGFNDAHSHPVLSGVEQLRNVACDSDSIEKIQAALRERAQKTPAGEWVLGFLYDDGKTPRPLNVRDLDAAVPDHPVMVNHRGGHTVFVNSKALQLAQVTDQTPDPTGGRFEHDAQGHLTGFAGDAARDVFVKLIPAPISLFAATGLPSRCAPSIALIRSDSWRICPM